MRISICVGDYAKVPYCIAGLELRVYCVEELCWCIRENAFLIDTSLMNDGLVNWIGKDCGLQALARELYSMVHKKGSLSAFVSMILEYTGLYDGEAVKEILQVLKKGAGLSNIEKRKNQVDYLVRKKKYAAAVKGYGELLACWEDSDIKRESPSDSGLPAAAVQAGILHNRGVAYTGLMLYGQAAECFLQAYEVSKEREELQAYLSARRMELSEEAYVALTAEMDNSYDAALELENKLEEIKLDWHLQPEFLRLSERARAWEDGDKGYCFDENEQMTQAMKDSYRSSVSD